MKKLMVGTLAVVLALSLVTDVSALCCGAGRARRQARRAARQSGAGYVSYGSVQVYGAACGPGGCAVQTK